MGCSRSSNRRGRRFHLRRIWVPFSFVILISPISASQCAVGQEDSRTMRAEKFVEAHVAKLKPLEKEAGLAWWNANISGKDEDFQRKEEAQNRIDATLADRDAFREL